MSIQKEVSRFLSQLEAEEARFLAWGYVDGGFSQDEIKDKIYSYLQNYAPDLDADEFENWLFESKLLIPLVIQGKEIWRTRMAETVRLLAKLKQLFPKQSWEVARTLVSDFRFTLQERRYPKRNIAKDIVLERLARHVSAVEHSVLNTLIKPEFQLSEFQVRATEQMLGDLKKNESRGMIVCAGTGTGKTMSFYLPALTHIAKLMVKNPGSWTKGLALYPRNELLKDQFMETYREARRLDEWLMDKVGRKMQIGAYFGPTPDRLEKVEGSWQEDKDRGGFICPYMRCPDCESPLLWMKADVKNEIERLKCRNGTCDTVINGDEVALTRETMRTNRPDLLFTSTEMLNRSMSDLESRPVFGIGVEQPPEIMLLDEVHTYSGVHGAQVALLLRRWHHAVNSHIHFTGLSATLNDAAEFFSSLVGLSRGRVEEINVGKDLISEGQEYQLILRGDPVSGTSLLSTTIQATMLIQRMLDQPDRGPSNGLFGEKVFVFTDDLDVTNRLYHTLLDAEGRTSWGAKNSKREPLALLRKSSHDDPDRRRLQAGQSWYFAEQIGHNLEDRPVIGRTSSQDAGVEATANVVVATASLEVGFNDPTVGAVIQHKAPLDMASFLQRKGRAGRNRNMRPWTITVLADYGRDRLMYQGYEMLFNPVIERRNLPVSNRYVLKMQGVYCMMDWMADEVKRRSNKYVSLWKDLSAPTTYSSNRRRQLAAVEVIKELFRNKTYLGQLENYLMRALRLSNDEVIAIMWEPPRALMTSVLPMLLRRLETEWRQLGLTNPEPHKFQNPLREFIPSNLFSDLNLPEISIVIPPARNARKQEEEQHSMPIFSAMKLFAPGRVTRRFGVRNIAESHWIAPPSLVSSNQPQALDIAQFCKNFEELGHFQMQEGDQVLSISCVRPWVIQPVQPDESIKVTSNAQLIWRSQIFPTQVLGSYESEQESGLIAEVPQGIAWKSLIRKVEFFTHNLSRTVTVRRFALGSDATVKQKPDDEIYLKIHFEDETGQPVALGYSLEVDGICFEHTIPSDETLAEIVSKPVILRSCKTAYFHHRVMTDSRLDGIASLFDRDRLGEVYLSVLALKADESEQSMHDQWEQWNKSSPQAFLEQMEEVFSVIFPTMPDVESDDMEVEDEDDEESLQFVHKRLRDLCSQDAVRETLHDLGRVLWGDADEQWYQWLRERWKHTLGGALLQACKEVAAESENGDLILDVDAGPRPDGGPAISSDRGVIWITETSVGGSGVIEQIVREYHADPRRFFRLVESALSPSDLELIDSEVTRCLEDANHDEATKELLGDIRQTNSYSELEPIMEKLHVHLQNRGILLTHSVISSIYNRVLKPGSSNETDALLYQLLMLWRTKEERLGIELDSRVFAYVFASNHVTLQPFRNTISRLNPTMAHDPHWMYQIVHSFLWPRGNQIRSRALDNYNPYIKGLPSDRELLLSILNKEKLVDFTQTDWQQQAEEHLVNHGVVSIIAPLSLSGVFQKALLDLAAKPLEAGFLHLYPRIEGLRREGDDLIATLDVREAIQ